MTYHHRQIGNIIIAGIVSALLVFNLWIAEQPGPVRLGVAAFLIVTLALFYSLTVEAKGNSLAYR